VNRKVKFWGKTWDVVGVMENFHQQSLKSELESVVFMPTYGTNNFFSFKVSPENAAQTIDQVKAKYLEFFPGNTFEYFFLDERFNRQYQDDILFGRLTLTFSILAIVVACLGLLGLSLYATIQRTKEIGVRKILGASVVSILVMLSRDFVRLILIANLIAWPVAWWVMEKWLQNYPYKIGFNLWFFILPALLVLIIALLTISLQTLRAARSNPANALRYE
jgi:putative ABC transport system permease protein